MTKREIIIQTARDLFTKFGYKKVSMDEIAREAGVTKRTIYSYFKDKDSMFLYFVEEELEKMKLELEKNQKENISFLELVTADIYHILSFRKNSLLISNLFKEAENINALECQKFIKIYDENIICYIEEKIKKAISNKTIKDCDSHLLAFIIYKIFLSIMFEYELSLDEEQVTKTVTTILKDGLFN